MPNKYSIMVNISFDRTYTISGWEQEYAIKQAIEQALGDLKNPVIKVTAKNAD